MQLESVEKIVEKNVWFTNYISKILKHFIANGAQFIYEIFFIA